MKSHFREINRSFEIITVATSCCLSSALLKKGNPKFRSVHYALYNVLLDFGGLQLFHTMLRLSEKKAREVNEPQKG